jgi:acyl carrier protein
MILQCGKPVSIQAILSEAEEGNFLFSIYSRTSAQEKWVMNASVIFSQQAHNSPASNGISADSFCQQSTLQINREAFYQTISLRGIQYGPGFRALQHVWINEEEILGRISLPESLENEFDIYHIHPALLDACLQVLAATQTASSELHLYIPVGCKRIRFFSRPERLIWSHVSLRSEPASGNNVLDADIRLLDGDDKIIAELIGFRLQRTIRRNCQLPSRQETWLYQVSWKAAVAATTSVDHLRAKRHWLIFAEDEGLGKELINQLESVGDHCHLLPAKKKMHNLESGDAGDLMELIETALKEITSALYGVVHLWSLSTPQPSPGDAEAIDKMQMLGCSSVLYLVQALTRRPAALPRLWLVTRGAQSVITSEPVAVEQSPLWGLGKVISFEFPELKCIRIDLDPCQANAEHASVLFKQISIDDREDQIAFRAGIRYVLRLLPFTMASSLTSPAVALRADSTYLITGGLGGLGVATAKWMANRGARHLLLLGRTEPSPFAISVVNQLRNEGIEVVIAQADVSDSGQLEEVLDRMNRTMPLVRGVIHAAGVLDDGALVNLNTERMKTVMAPKVGGTWNLHNATLNLPLDFFVLFSSAVSLLGSPGQGNYAAASAYLDAFAYYRRNLGLPALSINWGPWAEVGLASQATERLKEQNASTQHLIKVISIDQGLAVLEQLLAESIPHVMVLPFDLKNLIELYPTAAGMPFLTEVGGSDSHVARIYARPKLRQQYVAPRNEMELKLTELWRQTLHIDCVGVHDSFFELGGDSILAAQLLTLVQKTFGIRINPQEAFKAFTIVRLREMLEVEILGSIEAMSEDEARQRLSKRN